MELATYISASVISEIHTSGKITRMVLKKIVNMIQRENRVLFSEQNYFFIYRAYIHTWAGI